MPYIRDSEGSVAESFLPNPRLCPSRDHAAQVFLANGLDHLPQCSSRSHRPYETRWWVHASSQMFHLYVAAPIEEGRLEPKRASTLPEHAEDSRHAQACGTIKCIHNPHLEFHVVLSLPG